MGDRGRRTEFEAALAVVSPCLNTEQESAVACCTDLFCGRRDLEPRAASAVYAQSLLR